MATEITLSREWKQSLTTSKMEPFAMQVSLWDLLFFTNPAGQQCVRYIFNPSASNWKCNGFELPHNIIVLDEKMYLKPPKIEDRVGHRIIKKGYTDTNTEEEIIQNNLTIFDKWSSLGFDISLPWFDTRTKPLFLKESNFNKYVNTSTSNFSDLLSSLRPEKLNNSDFYCVPSEQQNYAAGFKIWDKDAALKPRTSYDFYLRSVLKPLNNLEKNTWEDYPDPWYIATEDDYADIWADINTDKNPGTLGADIILCNKDTSFENRFILPDSGFSAYNAICLNYRSPRVWKNFLKYYSATNEGYKPENSFTLSSDFIVGSINPVFNYLIKHCYVWIKCAFFADYVDYRDFNQSLNQKSRVIHNNLILGKGDYKRYEELYSTEGNKISASDLAKNTRPYFPTITPIKDKLREVLLTEDEFNASTKIELLENIIDNSASPESKIGSILTEPFEDIGKGTTSPNNTTKPYINEHPQIWFDPESRKGPSDYNDVPVLIGKEGNLITSGRILSPTIDELWHTIKEMIAGKKSDTDNTPEDNGGYPKNIDTKNLIPIDTRLKVPEHNFMDAASSNRIGDPTVIKIDSEVGQGDYIAYRVHSWINNPQSILYNVIKELKSASEEITYVGPNLEAIVNKIENLPKPEEYLPMATVPSLRELEGILKGLRWNLAYYIKFMLHNAVYVGSDGKINSENTHPNKAGGTAYLLHKDVINGISGIQNTVYDERVNRNMTVPYGIGVGKITNEMFGDNNQDIIPPWTVFMSAAGTWQSVSQALNVRIRTDEIW